MTITLAAVYTPVGDSGRPDRRAVPRVRLHAGRRGARLRRRGADAVADDGLEAAARRRHASAGSRAGSTAGSTRVRDALHARARAARCTTGPSCSRSGRIVVAADRAVLHVLAEGAGAGRGPGRRLRHRPGVGELDDRPDQAVRRSRSTRSTARSPRRRATFQITFPTGGFCGMVAKPWSERTKSTQQIQWTVSAKRRRDPRHPRHPASCRRRCRAAAEVSRSTSSSPRPRSRQQLAEFAEPARAEGVRERHVHVRRHRPEVRPAAGGGRLRSRQAALAGRRPGAGRPRPLDARSAATTSIASASRAAATRSSRRSSAASG